MRTRLLSGGTWVCGKTIVPEGLTGPQLSFNFTVRNNIVGGIIMETNEKTIVPQHAGTKRKWRIGCVVIITALVILGVVAGVVFTRQQEQHRQEMLTTLLSKILQGEFAEAEEIYCSLNEKTRQFVQSEVEQSLMREGFNWFVAQSDLISEVKSTTPYDFYKQSAESYMIFAQGFKDSDSALLEQGKSAVKEYLQGQILLLEDAKDMTENIRNILEDMLIMIEEY